MSTSLILAWMVGEGLMIYNDWRRQHRPPLPAELLSTSGLFILLALLAGPAPTLANLLAWGFDAAAFLVLFSGPANAVGAAGGPPTKKG